jgi:hypothetical protein
MKTRILSFQRGPIDLRQAIAVMTFAFALATRLYAAGEQRFSTPDEAMNALVAVAKSKDTDALNAIFGPESRGLMSSDEVQATNEFAAFVRRIQEKVELVHQSTTNDVLQLGTDGWPFPIPLVKEPDGQWFFDTPAGKEEILNRRIGKNELGAIRVCRAYLDAQLEYATEDRTGGGVLEYAQHLRSLPDKHDGLYWPMRDGDELSPLGPLVAQARGEGYRRETKILSEPQSPYHGYLFKILTRQGKHAPAGKYNYIINGHMIGGFAFVAWPEEWGNSGVMTFIVNQQGKIYQKNLGPKTASIAGAITSYDPDDTWSLVKD